MKNDIKKIKSSQRFFDLCWLVEEGYKYHKKEISVQGPGKTKFEETREQIDKLLFHKPRV